MPKIKNSEFECFKGCHTSYSERHTIVKLAAKYIVQVELEKLLMTWKKNLDEQGIDALKNLYSAIPKVEEDNEDRSHEEFPLSLDCDSDSDFSDH